MSNKTEPGLFDFFAMFIEVPIILISMVVQAASIVVASFAALLGIANVVIALGVLALLLSPFLILIMAF